MKEIIKFVRKYYPTAHCVNEPNTFNAFQIIDDRSVQISWLSGKASTEVDAWYSAKDAIIGRKKSVKKMKDK